jgi:prepilin-type N-terminal cleavage/methylation domain-containing protein
MAAVKNRKAKKMGAKEDKRGFTLVETIAASVIFCLAVLALSAGSTRSLSQTRLNRQYETAAALVDRQLTWIDYIGVEDFIESGQTEGDFEEYEPGYHWKVVSNYRGIDNLYLIEVTVSWFERNRLYSISVDTMFNGTSDIIESGTGSSAPAEQG